MRGLSNGIAHMSYRGGGLFLPARSPYDRQMLIELAVERVRTKGLVQILLRDRRWTLRPVRGRRTATCATCGRALDAVLTRADGDTDTYCVECAIVGRNVTHIGDSRHVRPRS